MFCAPDLVTGRRCCGPTGGGCALREVVASVEKLHAFDKAQLSVDHYDIDRIEVLVTTKAPCQVTFGVCGRIELTTHRTGKSEVSIRAFGRQHQHLFDQAVNGDLIAHTVELLW